MENRNLGPRACDDQHSDRALSPERRLVLALLRKKKLPIRVQSLASELGLHENTLREHLDGLVLSRHAEKTLIPSTGRGRPAFGYQALRDFISHVEPEAREYASLALVLAEQLNKTGGRAMAIRAGEEWAKEFIDFESLTLPINMRKRIIKILKVLGFSPTSRGERKIIQLQSCPLLAAAQREPSIICSVHLGLIRGLVDQSGGKSDEVKLIQFAQPGSCHLTLS